MAARKRECGGGGGDSEVKAKGPGPLGRPRSCLRRPVSLSDGGAGTACLPAISSRRWPVRHGWLPHFGADHQAAFLRLSLESRPREAAARRQGSLGTWGPRRGLPPCALPGWDPRPAPESTRCWVARCVLQKSSGNGLLCGVPLVIAPGSPKLLPQSIDQPRRLV